MARRKKSTKKGNFFVALRFVGDYYNDYTDDYEDDVVQINYVSGPFVDVETARGWVLNASDKDEFGLNSEDGDIVVVEVVHEFKRKVVMEEKVVRVSKSVLE